MSLLLDALKKTGQAQPDAAQEKPSRPGMPELALESLPEITQQKESRQLEDNLTRMSAHNLFAAKPARTGMRLNIVPLAILAGLLLAASGSYYVWREISPAPNIVQQSPTLPAAGISAPPPTAPLMHEPRDMPVVPDIASEITPKTQPASEEKPHTARRAPAPSTTVPHAVQPIRIEHIKEIAALDPALLAGYEAYRNGDLDTALKHYNDVLQKDARNHNTPNRDALLGLAAIAQQQSQDATAAQYYRQVLALDPRDPIAHAGMSALFGAADTAGTESRLKLLLAQQPQSAALHFALGNHYADQSRWGEAQQAYFEAFNRDPDNAYFAFNLAVSLDHLGQSKPAAQYYQRALQLSPSGDTGFNRAQAQQRANELAAP